MCVAANLEMNPPSIGRNNFSTEGHSLGQKDAPIFLLEYADFQCPFSARAAQTVREIQSIYGKKIFYTFRHFPIVAIHKLAEYCAQAAEAAGFQGEFWRMHDILFQNQSTLSKIKIHQIAKSIGLDEIRLFHDMESQEVRNRIKCDLQLGRRSKISQTPTFFINGNLFFGKADLKSLSNAIEIELAKPRISAA